MDPRRQTLAIAITVGVIVIGGIVGLFLLWHGQSEPELMAPLPTPPPPRVTPTPEVVEPQPPNVNGVTLNTSDALVRQLAHGLSSQPQFLAWLANDDLIRRFVASVENIANGKSPRRNLDFLAPKTGFKVLEVRGDYVAAPESYQRYDLVSGVFSALDTTGLVQLEHELKPLIDEAYREIAPPNRSFDGTLQRAIDHLLAVPVLDGDLYLKEKVVTYAYVDPKLEALSDAQRHLLRFGPHNVELVKQKLMEIQGALRASATSEDTEQ